MSVLYRAFYLLALTGAAVQLRADVTIRYELSEQSHLPAGFAYADQFANGHEMTIRVKGTRGMLSMGHFTSIVDLARKEVTVLNVTTKIFTTLPMDSLLKEGPENPLDLRATGRTGTIGGVPAEEQRSERGGFTWEIWVPKDGEAGRFPALAEFMRFQGPYRMKSSNGGMASLIAHEVGPDSISAMLTDLLQAPFLLRFRSAGDGLEEKRELVELSAAPIDDAALLPPQDFRQAPFTEVLKINPTPAPRAGSLPGSLNFTLVDGAITYGAEGGSRMRMDAGKRCRDLWVAPDESVIAFIRVDKSDGYDNTGEPFVRESTIFVARRSQNFAPVQVPISAVRVGRFNGGVLLRPSVSADGSIIFYLVPEGNYSVFFAYNLKTEQNQQVGGGIDYCTIWNGPDKGSILMYQRNWIGDKAGPEGPYYKYECFIAAPGSRDLPGSCKEFESDFKSGAACTLPPR